MDSLFSKILSNGKEGTGATPPVDTPPVLEVNEDKKSRLPVDDQGNPKPRHRRTQAEMAASRGEAPSTTEKIICPHDDVPDMPVGSGAIRSGIQLKESYPTIARMLENNNDFILLYLRTLAQKVVFCKDQRAKEEYDFMRNYFKIGGVL